MTWRQAANYIAVDCQAFLFELDEHRSGSGDQMLFVHLEVRKWSKATLKEMLAVFGAFRACVSCPLYAVAETDDDKWTRFMSYFGFTPHLESVVCENGEQRRLYINLKA